MVQEYAELELELMNWVLVILMMLSMFASGLGTAKITFYERSFLMNKFVLTHALYRLRTFFV